MIFLRYIWSCNEVWWWVSTRETGNFERESDFFSNSSEFFLCFDSKGCRYYCHAGAETATLSLASLWNLWAGVWARRPMVSQVSSLLVCACKDPRRRIQCMGANKEPFQWPGEECLESFPSRIQTPICFLSVIDRQALFLSESSAVQFLVKSADVFLSSSHSRQTPEIAWVIRPEFFFQTSYNDYHKASLLFLVGCSCLLDAWNGRSRINQLGIQQQWTALQMIQNQNRNN